MLRKRSNFSEFHNLGPPDSVELRRIAAHARHNALAPINKLPPEILLEIFHTLSAASFTPCFRQVTHVCRHWRAITHGCPRFWSFITNPSSPRMIKMMLSFTGRSLLRIKFIEMGGFYRCNLPKMTPLLKHTGRMQSIHILSSVKFLRKLFNKMTEPALVLETLDLTTTPASSPWIVPYTIFGGHAPRLHTLKLERCFIPQGSPFWTSVSLTCLELKFFPDFLSISSLLTLLGGLPSLQRLVIDHITAERIQNVGAQTSLPTICLPHLSYFYLHDDKDTSGALLENIDFPSCTVLDLLFKNIDQTGLSTTITTIASSIATLPAQFELTLGIYSSTIRLYASVEQDAIISLHLETTTAQLPSAIVTLIQSLRQIPIRQMTIDGSSDLFPPAAAWTEILNGFNELTTLRLDWSAVEPILLSLSTDIVEEFSDGQVPGILLPGLKTLEIYCGGTSPEIIRDFLQSRHIRQAILPKLVIYNRDDSFSDKNIRVFQRMADEVVISESP